ncbi:hypothetical protein CQA38_02360 [Campylobacter sp. MIT 12-5580]|uniref:hypothetical protein n=1 Tax=Campylobacter sp. MIT 12-5580 TaxID=2040651 RepID=UPI0010F9AA69|nr:hypothetical protein [Campylobacter sp. MIT 12-5580]TKX29636.1 hypothetical protein CQA38_02360 [Campylobacter sp. MIT 12-5580]
MINFIKESKEKIDRFLRKKRQKRLKNQVKTLRESFETFKEEIRFGEMKNSLYRYERNFENSPTKTLKENLPFIIFHYASHGVYNSRNLGDYIQSIATQKAITQGFENVNFKYFDRNALNFYPQQGGGDCAYARLVCTRF